MKIEDNIIKGSRVIIAIFLPLVLLMTILQIYTFNLDFYLNTYEKNNVYATTGMNRNDLERATLKLMNYLKDKEDNLDIEAVIHGEKREVFGEREKLHMVDVKHLFLTGNSLKNTGIVFVVVSLIVILKYAKNPGREFCRSIVGAGVLPIVFAFVLLILMQIDFNKYFTHFHEIFFDNDLWQLDPNKEVLIQMVPLEFFIEISTKIFSWFFGVHLLLAAGAYGLLKKSIRKTI